MRTMKKYNNEFVKGEIIEAEGDVSKGDGFIHERKFKGDPTDVEKGCAFRGDGFVALKKYEDAPINKNSNDNFKGDGYVALKQGQGKQKADKPAKAAKNISVIFPDKKKIEIDLPKGKTKLIDLKNRLLADKLIDNIDKTIFKQKDDDKDVVELLNDHKLYSWDKIYVTYV